MTSSAYEEPYDPATWLEEAWKELSYGGGAAHHALATKLSQRAKRIRSMSAAITDEQIIDAAMRNDRMQSFVTIGPVQKAAFIDTVRELLSSGPTLKPIRTKESPPTVKDANRFGFVIAAGDESWCTVSYSLVRDFPDTYRFWLPISALPVPNVEE